MYQTHAMKTERISKALLLTCILVSAFLMLMKQANAASTTGNDVLVLSSEHKDHLTVLEGLTVVENADAPSTTANTLKTSAIDNHITVVTFFASWCPPCLHEFKALNEIQSELGKENVTIVAVNVFEKFDNNDEARMAKFLRTTQPQFTVLKGTEQSRKLFGNVNRIPTLLVFDKNGNMAFDFVHARGATKQSVDSAELLEAIRPLL